MGAEINDQVLAQAQAIQDHLVDLNKNITDLTAYGKKSRKLIRILTVSIIFDVLLSLGLGSVAWGAKTASDNANMAARQAQEATSAAAQNASNVHAACIASNDGRKVSHELWQHLLDTPPTKPYTAAEIKQRVQFQGYIDKTFAPRNCDVVAPKPS